MAGRAFVYGRSDWQEDLQLAEVDDGGVGRRPANGRLEQVAQDVVIAKGEAMCEAMIRLAALRALKFAPRGGDAATAAITSGPARVQFATANSDDFEQQAAHLLPGNILVDGRDSWFVAEAWARQVRSPDARLALQLRTVFAATWSLPACFNRADSRSEQASGREDGLKRLFADAVGKLWRQAASGPAPTSPTEIQIDRPAIDTALRHWFGELQRIYGFAAQQKHAAAAAADGAVRERRLLEWRVLREYARSYGIASPMRLIQARPALRSVLNQYS